MLDVMKRRKLDAGAAAVAARHRLPSHQQHHQLQQHHHAPHQQQLYDVSAVSSYASLQQQLHQQQLSAVHQSQEHQQHLARRLFAPHYVDAHGGAHFQQQQQLFRQAASSSAAAPPLAFAANGAVRSPVVRADATAPRTESPQSLPGISSMLRRPTSGASVAAPAIASAGRAVVPGASASMLPRPRAESIGSASGGMVLSPADMYAGARSSSSSDPLPERWTPEATSISPVKSVSPLRLAPPLAATGSTFFVAGTASHHRHPHHLERPQHLTRGKRPAPTPAADLARVRSPSLRRSMSSLEDFKSYSSGSSSTSSTPRGGDDDFIQLPNGFVAAVAGAADCVDADALLLAASSRAASVAGEERIANPNKNSRYLREMDRREILSRIEQGEKQATLAKEYQVSRAAICNLNKHRDEVMSRKDENPLAKHPKKPRPKSFKLKIRASKSKPKKLPSPGGSRGTGGAGPGKAASIHEVKSRAAALLLTSVRNKNTSLGEFRRCSERLLRLVLEDALALVPIKAVEVFLSDLVKADGVGWEHPPCAVSMEQRQTCGSPLLDLFRAIEPDQPSARVSMSVAADRDSLFDDDTDGLTLALTDAASLPPSLKYHNVFVLDFSATSPDAICRVIQRLQERGAVEAMISLVVLFIASDVILAVHSRFPGVKVVAAQIDPSGKRPPTPTVAAAADDAEDHGVPPCCLHFVVDRFRQVYA